MWWRWPRVEVRNQKCIVTKEDTDNCISCPAVDPNLMELISTGNLAAIPPEQLGQLQGVLKNMPMEQKEQVMGAIPQGNNTRNSTAEIEN